MAQKTDTGIDQDSYQILTKRLENHTLGLQEKLNALNEERKLVFGSVETKLLHTERVTTKNNCLARDMISLGNGNYFLFGYNVTIGLRTEMGIDDVFSVYHFIDNEFHPFEYQGLNAPTFLEDFRNLYRYYKNSQFSKLVTKGPYLYMVFRIGNSYSDIKTFKWLLEENKLTYIDNRSDHEVSYPSQHQFNWVRTTRDMQKKAIRPYLSLNDVLFIEIADGKYIIRIEDNSETGEKVYEHPIDLPDQTLDDIEIHFAVIDNLIALKIRPYQENNHHYLLHNQKTKEVLRIDSIKDSCVLLPDNHGIIFPKGNYLQTGEKKIFEYEAENIRFEQNIASPNGEDYLYVFYHPENGLYILLSYNIILQEVNTPIFCHGFTLFEDGRMLFFRTDNEQRKHHAVQIWQTPFYHPDYDITSSHQDHIIYKIGNKEVVRAMAECHEIIALSRKKDNYDDLYVDLVQKATDILDTYHWIHNKGITELSTEVKNIKDTALQALSEFEKVVNLRKIAQEHIQKAKNKLETLEKERLKQSKKDVAFYVHFLAEYRMLRGELISLKNVRYIAIETLEKLDATCQEQTAFLAQKCVDVLLEPNALDKYKSEVQEIEKNLKKIGKVADAQIIEENIKKVSDELEMLIEIVGNLKIADATQTTAIIDNITQIYTNFNNIRARLKKKRQELAGVEAHAEFYAQLNLLDQGLLNYLELANTPDKADEYLTKLSISIQELESKFADFEEFIPLITEKQEKVLNTFEAHKVALTEKRNKRAQALFEAAERIFKGIKKRVENLKSVTEINAFFASDLMVDKLRSIIENLRNLNDNVKADDLESKIKAAINESIRQLKDKTELYSYEGGLIQLGKHQFAINKLDLGISLLQKNKKMYYHINGTAFYEEIKDTELNALSLFWNQTYISETEKVYRAEYLAYMTFQYLLNEHNQDIYALEILTQKELEAQVATQAKARYDEGYSKGIHDLDAAQILHELIFTHAGIGMLRFSPKCRSLAAMFWFSGMNDEVKSYWNKIIKAHTLLFQVFPKSQHAEQLVADLSELIEKYSSDLSIFSSQDSKSAAQYLLLQLSKHDYFVIDEKAAVLYESFYDYLNKDNKANAFNESMKNLSDAPKSAFITCISWLKNHQSQHNLPVNVEHLVETAQLIVNKNYDKAHISHATYFKELQNLKGEHELIIKGNYLFDYHNFIERIENHLQYAVPQFTKYQELKRKLSEEFKQAIRLNEFEPQVMNSFVRNKLINDLYLPLIGDNLAKQIGAHGNNKRADRSGLLLLLSPPGYGKTTLMEYLAHRLGIIFMKVNGPAIGHSITSVDPQEASNAAAKQELEKLNLAFEMGDNVMIYLDDIQHCNPEFLQKFISLCDATRKIEGVYKGQSKTYDFRGKKVCVVIAGNPYTESGEKFQIPDMLANRADIYNLGDIIGDTETIFKMSYLENALTSNSITAQLSSKSTQDVFKFIQMAENNSADGIDLEAKYTSDEISEIMSVMQKMLHVRNVVSKVNAAYIASAAQADEYRTEPPFKLQGSYRDMNKLVQGISPLMNEQELETLIVSHYQSEAQTLTAHTEANLLKFKTLVEIVTETEAERWKNILEEFNKNNKLRFGGKNSQVLDLIEKMNGILGGLKGIEDALNQDKYFLKINNLDQIKNKDKK